MNLRLLTAFLTSAVPAALTAQDKPAAPAAEKRTIVFHRPETKGAKYDLSATYTSHTTTDFMADKERRPGPGAKNLDVSLDGRLEVTAVSEKSGSVTGYTFTVKKMTLTAGGEDEAFEPGTIITAKVDKFQTAFYAHGDAVEGSLMEGLREVLPRFSGMDEPVDETFAPPGPVAPGDKWEPNLKRFAEVHAAVMGVEVDEANSKLHASFKGPAAIAGHEGDTIILSQNVAFSRLKGLPENATLKSYSMTYDTTFTLARDVKISAALSERGVSEMALTYTMKHEDEEVDVIIKTGGQVKRSMTPVK
jgi:hypothetical protein